MNLANTEILQVAALFLAVIEFILAFYVSLLNTRHVSNHHVGTLLLLGAITTLAQGLLIGASNAADAYLPTAILAATVVPVQPALLIVAIVLLKPEWMPFTGIAPQRGRWRRLWYGLYAFALLPLVLTLIDVTVGTRLWYTGLDPATYQGGAVGTVAFTQGSLAAPIKLLAFQIIPLLTFVPLLYVAFRDKKATPLTRRLAGLLLVQQVGLVAISLGTRGMLPDPLPDLLPTAIFVFTYAYVIFQQMVSERRAQRGRLRIRLTAQVLAVAVPLLVGLVALVSLRAGAVIEQKADDQLRMTDRSLAANVSVWLNLNVGALQELATLPAIVSMEADQQRPVLEAMAAAYPHMYLVSTTDLNGINVARNDDEAPKDYSDRPWFSGARYGAPLTFQTLVGRTSGAPALVASVPIRDQSGSVVGVAMFAANLTDIAQEVLVSKVGESGFAYVVDAENRVVAHPDPAYMAELRDIGASAPIIALRHGTRGAVSFSDEERVRWRAYVDELESGWGVVVQQPEAELLSPLRSLQRLSWMTIAIGALVLFFLTGLTIRQAIQPIGLLTETAAAIAAGDLTSVVPVVSEDEFGVLAQTFNSMTRQLRALIGSLEQQVQERTQDLERRSGYLQASAEVGRAATSILETDQLIREVVELIRERFGLYYVGLFLVDPAREWAVLRAGTGRAGQAMLARGHRIRVGEGMVGWTVTQAQPRVALEAGEDAVRLATPELPETRSEAALPLRSRGRVLGALTVQHTQPDAFDQDILAVLQTMADQVAVALDNARLYTESQAALEAERRSYGEQNRQAWFDLLRSRPNWGYRYAAQRVQPVAGERKSEMVEAEKTGQMVQGNGPEGATLAVPLKIRDKVVGVLGFRKEEADGAWSAEETALLQAFAAQFELALDSARLFEDTQRRAARERLTGEVTSRIRETLDLETVLKTTAQELRQALGTPEVVVRLVPAALDRGGGGSGRA